LWTARAHATTWDLIQPVSGMDAHQIEREKMYDVWKIHCTQGQGDCVGPECFSLVEAIEEVIREAGNGSFAIECPDGSYYEFNELEKEILEEAWTLSQKKSWYIHQHLRKRR
jgi:hypothetical protein